MSRIGKDLLAKITLDTDSVRHSPRGTLRLAMGRPIRVMSGINLVIYRLWDWIINWRSHGDNESTHDYQASKCIIMDSWWYKLTIQCYLASWTPPLSHAVWKSHNINIIRDDVFPVFTTAKHRWCSFSPTGGIGLINQARQAWKTVSHDCTPVSLPTMTLSDNAH